MILFLAASGAPHKLPADWIGWAFVIAIIILLLRWVLGILGLRG